MGKTGARHGGPGSYVTPLEAHYWSKALQLGLIIIPSFATHHCLCRPGLLRSCDSCHLLCLYTPHFLSTVNHLCPPPAAGRWCAVPRGAHVAHAQAACAVLPPAPRHGAPRAQHAPHLRACTHSARPGAAGGAWGAHTSLPCVHMSPYCICLHALTKAGAGR